MTPPERTTEEGAHADELSECLAMLDYLLGSNRLLIKLIELRDIERAQAGARASKAMDVCRQQLKQTLEERDALAAVLSDTSRTQAEVVAELERQRGPGRSERCFVCRLYFLIYPGDVPHYYGGGGMPVCQGCTGGEVEIRKDS